MRSKRSNLSKDYNWNSPIDSLPGINGGKSLESLQTSGINTLEDLLWLIPLKIHKIPLIQDFSTAKEGEYFRGQGKVISLQSRPNFKAKGKGRAPLLNVTAIIKDDFSDGIITLKWFNCYQSIYDKIKKIDLVQFIGIVTEFQGSKQILNPEISEKTVEDTNQSNSGLKIQYPTVNGVNTANIKKIIDKIPIFLWDQIEETLPIQLLQKRDLLSLNETFKIIHAKVDADSWSEEKFIRAKERLIYEEFFLEQIKISIRKNKITAASGIIINTNNDNFEKYCSIFPYDLTPDQKSALDNIRNDFTSGKPMMRLIQGDVGCGKTSVALISSLMVIKNGHQVAFMCPTESLALQHFKEATHIFSKENLKIELIIGSTTEAQKKKIREALKNGEIDLIIGTHALIQDNIEFKNLGLSIIDEQHKFGVDQRLKLTSKTIGSHSLIMTATPIPRSLCLTQYGDLEISVIKTMPKGRKGCQTRIVTPLNFDKFLSFMKTRLEMKEQVYIIVPAINESVDQEILHLEKVYDRFKDFFPEYRIVGLHGQLKSDDKASILQDFNDHKIDVLVATSVIEVGINVVNATIMAIMNPERFGLSSLHQMRGRVGRGDKPGFCFLVNDRQINGETLNRLQVIEKYTDGFKIAEEDLKIRGSGDLFGTNQSGIQTSKKIADIIYHSQYLVMAREDYLEMAKDNALTPKIEHLIKNFSEDVRIFSTI